MWERGLKQHSLDALALHRSVAPHVGAWIETVQTSPMSRCPPSLPMLERGLKYKG